MPGMPQAAVPFGPGPSANLVWLEVPQGVRSGAALGNGSDFRIGAAVELNEVVHRIVVRHWAIIVVCFMLGLGASLGLSFKEVRTFTATSRITLDTPTPRSSAEAIANSDTARAIVTAHSQVRAALEAAHARRDVGGVARDSIQVQALGSSGVIEIAVIDRDPDVAAKIANVLAANVVKIRLEASRGEATRLIRELDKRIAALNRKLTDIDSRYNQVSPQAANNLLAQRDDLSRQLDTIELQRLDLSREFAVAPKPMVVEEAEVPGSMDPSKLPLNVALGGLLGLVVGVGAAAVLETLRPTLVGPRALAQAAGAPILGVLPKTPDAPQLRDVAIVASRLQLAAASAEVDTVALITAGRPFDLPRFVDSLHRTMADAFLKGARQPRRLLIESFSLAILDGDYQPGIALVLVAPAVLPKSELDVVGDVLSMTGWPLLGVIAYGSTPGRSERAQFAEPDYVGYRDRREPDFPSYRPQPKRPAAPNPANGDGDVVGQPERSNST